MSADTYISRVSVRPLWIPPKEIRGVNEELKNLVIRHIEAYEEAHPEFDDFWEGDYEQVAEEILQGIGAKELRDVKARLRAISKATRDATSEEMLREMIRSGIGL